MDYYEHHNLVTSVRFEPGQSSSLFGAFIHNDDIDEYTENFTIILQVPSGQVWSDRVLLSKSRAIVQIIDSDEDRKFDAIFHIKTITNSMYIGVSFSIAIASRNTTVVEGGSAEICTTRSGVTDIDYQLMLQTMMIPGGAIG